MNWWVVRERGVTLYGPSPAALSAPVSQEESVQAAREHAQGWREWGYESRHRRAQAYAILTLCRTLRIQRVSRSPSGGLPSGYRRAVHSGPR